MSDFGGAVVCDPSKTGGGQSKLRGGQGQKAGAVVWQWVPTFKEAVPPTPPGVESWSQRVLGGNMGPAWSGSTGK